MWPNSARCTLGAIHRLAFCNRAASAEFEIGASMFLNFYSVLSKDLSGTGLLAVAFASLLGMLLIWDARGNRENQRNK